LILPFLFSISLAAKVDNSTYKIHETELKAIETILKSENEKYSNKNVNICVIICYYDTSLIPIGIKPCNFISIVSDDLKSDRLSVEYVSFGASEEALTNMKNILIKIGSGLPFSKLNKIARLSVSRPKRWGNELIVDDLLNSSIRRTGKYNYSVDTGSMYYVGIGFGNKYIATFELEQVEKDWRKVKDFIEPIANAIYRNASK